MDCTPELAAAVSNAGGCGFVCAHQAGSPETCVEWLKQMDELTDKPWGVNLTILREFTQAEGYCDAIIEAQVRIGQLILHCAAGLALPAARVYLFERIQTLTVPLARQLRPDIQFRSLLLFG